MRTPPLCDLYVLDQHKQVRPAKSADEWRLNLKNNPVIITYAFGLADVRTSFTGVATRLDSGGRPLVFQTIVIGRDYPTCYTATYRDAMDSHWRAEWMMGREVPYVMTPAERRALIRGIDGGKRERRPARPSARPTRDLEPVRSNE